MNSFASTPRSAQDSSEPHPLSRLFRPRSIVLYGASDRSSWSNGIFMATRAAGFDGRMYAVNRRGAEAHGLPAFCSAQDIPEPVDAAYVYVPAEGVIDALEDLGAAGVKAAVILTSGFAETGDAGAEQQSRLVEVANRHGIRFLGPNSLGFANLAEGVAISSIPPVLPVLPGRVGLVSQSGAICSEIMDFAHQQGVGLSFFAATGNEAMLDVGAIADFLVDDPNTDVVAVFAETIRNPAHFLRTAEKALAARKPIVVLKVGTSEISAAVAKAHTGSLVGDDRVFDAACAQYGVIRADSIEDLIVTAGLLAHTGVLEQPGVGVVSISGGGCGLFADAAEKAGVSVPAFAPETIAALQEVQSSYGATLNPFDITGAAIGDPSMFEKCLDIIGRDPAVGLTICAFPLANAEGPAKFSRQSYASMGLALGRLGRKGFIVSAGLKSVNDISRALMRESGIPATFGGIDHVVRALGKAAWWSERTRSTQAPRALPASARLSGTRPRSEREVLDFLAGFGVPVISAVVATTAEQAVKAAREMGGRLALKIASPDIQHKTEVGGVKLNVIEAGAAQAFEEIVASARRAQPEARIDGVIVSPMRAGGVELLVGTARDPQWGPVIVLGLGGVFVEVLKDTALRLLPVRREEVVDMLRSLRAVKLLRGFRGAPAADLEAIAEVVVKVGNAALSLGPDLAALEINPLRVLGSEVEALDGLMVWNDAADAPTK